MTQETHESALNHPKNVTVGQGRIIYAEAWYPFPAGWVLPGGERTQDERRAHEAARWIDSVTSRKVAPVEHHPI